jgi:predicted ATPase
MADGLLLKNGPDTYRFSHDQIWLAAYSLMSEKDKGAMHLQIGRKLHEELKQGRDADLSLSTVVDQYNRGKKLSPITLTSWRLQN